MNCWEDLSRLVPLIDTPGCSRENSEMQLAYKRDFDRAREVLKAYWEGEIISRPPVWATVTRPARDPTALRGATGTRCTAISTS